MDGALRSFLTPKVKHFHKLGHQFKQHCWVKIGHKMLRLLMVLRAPISVLSFSVLAGIRKRVAEKANLTKALFDRLPAWDKVEDMDFSDASGTNTFAYCNSKRCERLTGSNNRNDPWTNRFHVTGGALEFLVQKEDDGREIIVKIHKTNTVRVERIWIFVDTSSGNNIDIMI